MKNSFIFLCYILKHREPFHKLETKAVTNWEENRYFLNLSSTNSIQNLSQIHLFYLIAIRRKESCLTHEIAGSISENMIHGKGDDKNVRTEEKSRTWARTCRNTGKWTEVEEKDQERK